MLSRALRGLRLQLGTQLLSTATVALALLCLAGALLALENAGAWTRRWGAPVRVTVFLTEGADQAATESLRGALAALPEVEEARFVSSAEAREALGRTGTGDRTIAEAPVELFPASIELRLVPSAVSADRVAAVAARVRRLPMVAEVETYRGFTERLSGMLSGGRAAMGVIAFGVMLCVLAVVSNTVRMSLQARMREIEVMRLVGASPSYVRGPFLLEGAMLGALGAAAAIVVLGALFFTLRAHFEASFGALLGMHPEFLSWGVLALLLSGGAGLGALGSGVALRRGLAQA
ncbi:MAG: ABC transporter permease [Myxococcales bacterium]|nr:ABC transporter permease [Myxococcales bacterium]